MNPEYFKSIYEYAYGMFSEMFTESEADKYSVIRVDSTLVKQAANKLQQGIIIGNKHRKNKYVKYTVSMENLFPSDVEVFTSNKDTNENKTIPKIILNQKHKTGVFVFDRGVNARNVFDELDSQGVSFVTRINPSNNIKIDESNILKAKTFNNLVIFEEQIVRLYNKQGKISKSFRLIKTKKNDDLQEELWFLTNCWEMELHEVISLYRKRWDIEVFFRFIKQELNFSHFVSTSINGIKNVLYITLTLSILILIYKKANSIGYKTAVRRFRIELDELITKMIIAFAGGDPGLVFT